MNFSVSNITASFTLHVKLNLPVINKKIWNTEYQPKKKNSLTLRNKDPRFTANIHSSGKVILVGLNSLETIQPAVTVIRKLLRKINVFASPGDVTINNIVGSGNINTTINMSDLYDTLISDKLLNVRYNAELFPGMAISFVNSNNKIFLFRTGKYFATGCKTIKEIENSFSAVEDYVTKHTALYKDITDELDKYLSELI